MMMPEGGDRRICKVCLRQHARYTCPRCNLPYCSLDCYKQHGQRCTESFYRDQAVEQLRGTRASAEERRHMLQVLARVHGTDGRTSAMEGVEGSYEEAEEDEEEQGSQDSSEDGVDDSDAACGTISSILSDATKARLKQKAQAALEAGKDFEIDVVADLTATERAALERLELQGSDEPAVPATPLTATSALGSASPAAAPPAAAGGAVQPRRSHAMHPGTGELWAARTHAEAAATTEAPTAWVPWWLSDATKDLQLNATGRPLVAELPATQAVQSGTSGQAPSTADGGGGSSSSAPGALPHPPAEPLPHLSALTKAKPSPLLRWQLLQLLFGYSMVSRLQHETQGMDALQAAELLLALVPALDVSSAGQPGPQLGSTAPVHGDGEGDGSSSSSSSSSMPALDASPLAALDARSALSACLVRACTPPTGTSTWRQVAVQAVGDAAAMVRLGRSALVLALTDTGRILEAGTHVLKHAAGGRISRTAKSAGTAAPAATGKHTDGLAAGTNAGLKQRLKPAAAKVRFFTVWANEQEPLLLQQVAAATDAEYQQQAMASRSSQSTAAGAAAIVATPIASVPVSDRQPNNARASQSAVRKLVQELPGTAHTPRSDVTAGQSAGMPAVGPAATTAAGSVATGAAAGAGAGTGAGAAVAAAELRPAAVSTPGVPPILAQLQPTQGQQHAESQQGQLRTQQHPLDVFELD